MNNLLLFIKAQHLIVPRELKWCGGFGGASLPPGSPTRLKRALIVCVVFYGAVWKRGMHSSRHSNARGKAASRAGQTPQVVNALKRSVCMRVCKGVRAWGCVNANASECVQALDWKVFTPFTSTFSLLIQFATHFTPFFSVYLSSVVAWNDFLLPPLRKEPRSFCFSCF